MLNGGKQHHDILKNTDT